MVLVHQIKEIEDGWNEWITYEKKAKTKLFDKTNDEGLIKRI